MRIHTVAALYVLFFSVFFRFTPAEYGVLILTIGSVLSAELFNTAAEDLCDFVSPGFAERIGSVKDLAAGAVLVCLVWGRRCSGGRNKSRSWEPGFSDSRGVCRSFCFL